MSDLDAAKKINDFFANVGKDLAQKIPKVRTKVDQLQALRPPGLDLPPLNIANLYKVTKNIKPYKSSGMDTISSSIWKVFYGHFNQIMVHLYNLILLSTECPDDWKIGTVVPIPKVEGASKPAELRPISLLPLPGKTFEHYIHDTIQEYLDREGLLSKFQNGFRKNHSTQQTVFKYTTDLLQYNNNNLTSIATYIDFKKAFDTVNHKLLIEKLKKYGLSLSLTNLLESYLTNRLQCTVVHEQKSDTLPVHYGVP